MARGAFPSRPNCKRAFGMTIFRRTFYIILLAVAAAAGLCPTPAAAQTRKVMNRPYIDQRRLHYGFMAGVHMQDIEFQNNGFTDESGNQWYADQGSYEPGFSVGILGELYLTKHLAVRTIPTMHFGTKQLTFNNHTDGSVAHQTIKSTYVSIPVDLKFSAERFNNYRPYMMCGVNAMYDLTVRKSKEILLKPFNVYLEAGIGCDFYLPFFKFIPEIKFCYGLANVVNKDRSDLTDPNMLVYTNSVDNAHSKMIVISFYFE